MRIFSMGKYFKLAILVLLHYGNGNLMGKRFNLVT
jgi:hypothetical protein